MKKIFVLFAVITALTVNTFAYTPSFALSGENETQDPVFRVRIFAKMIQTEQIPLPVIQLWQLRNQTLLHEFVLV